MKLPFATLDVFTTALRGKSLAVVLDADGSKPIRCSRSHASSASRNRIRAQAASFGSTARVRIFHARH